MPLADVFDNEKFNGRCKTVKDNGNNVVRTFSLRSLVESTG